MSQKIDTGFSLYLDIVRLVAALVVMLAHAQVSGLIALPNGLLDLAPHAVIVFFVLSGYIIEATTDSSAGLSQYVIHRTARIYSVVIPAVLVSFIVSGGFASASATRLLVFQREWLQWWRLPVILSFQGEDWFAVVEVPWNGPFWSLNYEVFYYILYAVLKFAAGKLRILLVIVVCLIAGPKILLLLPCWWLGVELARRPMLRLPSRGVAWAILIGSPVFIVALAIFHLGNWIQRHLIQLNPDFAYFDHSTLFLTDYMTAAMVAAGFVAARQLAFGQTSLLVRLGKPINVAAGYTFSIYLLHRPLQHLASQYFQVATGGGTQALGLQIAILAAIVAIGSQTERRTALWRRLITPVIRPLTRPDLQGVYESRSPAEMTGIAKSPRDIRSANKRRPHQCGT